MLADMYEDVSDRSPFATAYHLARDEGRALWHDVGLETIKATSEDTAGRMWVAVQVVPEGAHVPLYGAAHSDEAWYVVEGEVTVAFEATRTRARTGSFIFAPHGARPSARVDSPTATILLVGVPGGDERFYSDTGQPAGSLTLPPARRLRCDPPTPRNAFTVANKGGRER